MNPQKRSAGWWEKGREGEKVLYSRAKQKEKSKEFVALSFWLNFAAASANFQPGKLFRHHQHTKNGTAAR